MPNKMLIDATHPEETRVVVLRGNRVEEFDFESAQRKQLRGNIYLAKVTRVEPSLQAAFIEYGGNRHGFLAFSEIHPDYYQIPVADREALIEEDERAHREAETESENRANRRRPRGRNARRRGERVQSQPVEAGSEGAAELAPDLVSEAALTTGEQSEAHEHEAGDDITAAASVEPIHAEHDEAHEAAQEFHPGDGESHSEPTEAASGEADERADDDHADSDHDDHGAGAETDVSADDHGDDEDGEESEEDVVESIGGDDALEEVPERSHRPRRQYKIQEVIKRRQVMLVQVVKEERGNKGAALTTYLSLAGRYSVLMPNTARGGGISRKITSSQDRHRLKEVVQDLDVPEGMGVILRTAGASRTKTEIKRDFEYLLRVWENVRDLTLHSSAPTLVYEEGSLIKRSIRDLYNKDIDEVIVAGEAAYQEARDFMRMLMPSHVRNVKLYRDPQPLFSRMGIETQLDAMFSPTVQLRSGGYIVINQTEALVSIDVNSGRSTREHHIEDTALKTNLEAAEEVARQLRLRDLAGLIVIDFIDMDEKRNNRAVERKIADCLKHDRARIQVGRISHFGLLEMSRQRIRASVLESSTEPCPHCGGTGHVRSVASVALQLLRALEETLMKGATHNLIVRTRTEVALYVLNHKRAHLRMLEERFKVLLAVTADAAMTGPHAYVIERGEQVHTLEAAKALLASYASAAPVIEQSEEEFAEAVSEEEGNGDEQAAREETSEGEARRGKRRRRRRGRRDESGEGTAADGALGEETTELVHRDIEDPLALDIVEREVIEASDEEQTEGERQEAERRRRRRGRRGGRRRRGSEDRAEQPADGELAAHPNDLLDDSADEHATAHAHPPEREPAPHVTPLPPAEIAPPPVVGHDQTEPAQKAPKRRSTVREPVSFIVSEMTPVDAAEDTGPKPQGEDSKRQAETAHADADGASQPAASADTANAEPTADDASRPRRSGWWSRR